MICCAIRGSYYIPEVNSEVEVILKKSVEVLLGKYSIFKKKIS